MQDIHIAMTSSNSFIEYCNTCMASILYNIKDECMVHFYILTFDITEKIRKK